MKKECFETRMKLGMREAESNTAHALTCLESYCMTVENGRVKYQIINAYFTFNAGHPSLLRCRNFQQRVLIATALTNSRFDYCNSLFLNVSSYQLYPLMLLLKPASPLLRPFTYCKRVKRLSIQNVRKERGEESLQCRQCERGEVRGHAVIRKTADNPGQNRSTWPHNV